jgi:hypothetical protein
MAWQRGEGQSCTDRARKPPLLDHGRAASVQQASSSSLNAECITSARAGLGVERRGHTPPNLISPTALWASSALATTGDGDTVDHVLSIVAERRGKRKISLQLDLFLDVR